MNNNFTPRTPVVASTSTPVRPILTTPVSAMPTTTAPRISTSTTRASTAVTSAVPTTAAPPPTSVFKPTTTAAATTTAPPLAATSTTSALAATTTRPATTTTPPTTTSSTSTTTIAATTTTSPVQGPIPTAMTMICTRADPTTITCRWSADATPGVTYRLGRYRTGDAQSQVIAQSLNALTFTDTNLLAAQGASYRVQAIRPDGIIVNQSPAVTVP